MKEMLQKRQVFFRKKVPNDDLRIPSFQTLLFKGEKNPNNHGIFSFSLSLSLPPPPPTQDEQAKEWVEKKREKEEGGGGGRVGL